MKVLGIKCSKQELGWIVMEGTTRADATVVAYEKVKAPAGERGEQLVWARKELLEVIAKHTPDVAALRMSEGQNALAERSQMDGVVLATLYQKEIATVRLFSATIRSKFSVQKKEQVEAAVAAMLACASKTPAAQKELITVAAAVFPN
jgi:Holliday junction resolvasome RuvABC endonuclease subunit